MKFELVYILEKIKALYELPRSRERFDQYLSILQGESADELVLPIAGYNPMAKEAAVGHLEQLISLEAEKIAAQQLEEVNQSLFWKEEGVFQVVINLIDDVEGAWSNRYATDYTSKFELAPLIKRNFCTPCFWTSETLTEQLIIQRVRTYIYRTLYWLENGSPATLYECLKQESWVLAHTNDAPDLTAEEKAVIEPFFYKHKTSQDYSLKFNFFYGDKAAASLGYAAYGMPDFAGFKYATYFSGNIQNG